MKPMVGMVVLSSVTKMKTAKFTDITPSSVRFIFFYLAEMQSIRLIDCRNTAQNFVSFFILFKQCPAMEPFENDHELEQDFAEVVRMNTVDVMDIGEDETEMESALNEYAQIGSDLGIIPMQCKHFAGDPCWLARWLVGDDKVPKVI